MRRDDAERARTAVVDDREQIDHPEPRPAAEQRAESQDALAEKGEPRHDPGPARGCPGPDPHQPGRLRASPAGLPLGNGLGEVQEALGPLGKPGAIAFNAAGPRLLEHPACEGDEARVPVGDTARVEGETMDARAHLDLAPYVARVR